MSNGEIMAYRLEWKPGDYVHTSPEGYAKEICKEGARVWALYTKPQPDCPQEIALYRGKYFVQPKHVYDRDLTGFVPLYLGPLINDPK